MPMTLSLPKRQRAASRTLRVSEGEMVASHAGVEVARHAERRGRRGGASTAPARDAPAAGRVQAPARRCLVMAAAMQDRLEAMLARLKLSALGDRLDNLLDGSGHCPNGRRELSLREGLIRYPNLRIRA